MNASMGTTSEHSSFPTLQHRTDLRRRCSSGKKNKDGSIDNKPINEWDGIDRWHYFAYDYGWRRFFLGTMEPASPIDPPRRDGTAKEGWGKYYDPAMAAAVQVMFIRHFGGQASHKALAPKPPSPSADDIAHVEGCVRQITANLDRFALRSQRAFSSPVAAVHREMGITATEQTKKPPKHEDPDELRKAMMELDARCGEIESAK